MPSDGLKSGEVLEKDLRQTEKQIRELKGRLPAHSIKPAMMGELFELEDQRESILAQIQMLSKDLHPF